MSDSVRAKGEIETPLLWKGTWIEIRFVRDSATGRTWVWEVTNDGVTLGEVRWFSRWRKYALHPEPNTVWEETCLREIAQFCELRTLDHRELTRKALTP